MQNSNSCRSCNCFKRTRKVSILGKELTVKNYLCSKDGGSYKEMPEQVKLQLSITPTSFCSAKCPFCIAENTSSNNRIDPKKLEKALIALKDAGIIRGITLTGGEPFTDLTLLDEIICMIYELLGFDAEISITTNGHNLHRIGEIKYLRYVDALHVSRHHYDDEINSRIFGIKMPTKRELRDIIHSVSYRDIFVLNCMLLKGYIYTAEEVHKYLDFGIETGAGKVSFITCYPCNSYAAEHRIEYPTVINREDPSLLFTRSFCDFEYCRCQDGIYHSPLGDIIEFYARTTSPFECEYCRGLVYGADNRLRAGFKGDIVI